MDVIPSMLFVVFVACNFSMMRKKGVIDVDVPLGKVQPIINSREMRGKLFTGSRRKLPQARGYNRGNSHKPHLS
jgi:hypothetical protein